MAQGTVDLSGPHGRIRTVQLTVAAIPRSVREWFRAQKKTSTQDAGICHDTVDDRTGSRQARVALQVLLEGFG